MPISPGGNTGNPYVDTGLILFGMLLDLFQRHQQGENVSKDLIALQSKVRTLLEQEQLIANTPVDPPLPFVTFGNINPVEPIKTTEEIIEDLKKNDNQDGL